MENGVLRGNLVLPDRVGYGEIEWAAGRIVRLEIEGEREPRANWILPGFIEMHYHGLGHWNNESEEGIRAIAAFAPSTGVTSFLPTLSARPWEMLLGFLRNAKRLSEEPPGGARVLGSHLEGPFIEPGHKGGMHRNYLQEIDDGKITELLEAAGGSLRLITLSPELPGALEAIRRFAAAGATVSIGHTGCSPELFAQAVEAGVRQFCHLFDAMDGREVRGGVSQVSLADAAMLEERVRIELICDGFHVPPPLIELTRRVVGADRIIGVTDCAQGTGLPDGVYTTASGRQYTLNNAEVCRLVEPPHIIIGSCVTMKRMFFNLIDKFNFSPVEASRILSGSPAANLGLAERTGSLKLGLAADLVELAPDAPEVVSCRVDGAAVDIGA